MTKPSPAHAAPTLTIGIPTFNRAEAVREVLYQLCAHESANADYLHILVVDDGSTDATVSRLEPFGDLHDRFRLLRNPANLGFQGNLLELIRRTETDFLLIGSDDDFFVTEHLDALHEFLRNRPDTAIVATQWRSGTELSRGEDGQRPLDLNDFRRCCAHLPGTVFQTRLAQAIVNDTRIQPLLLDSRNFYPQCMVAFVLLLLGHGGHHLPYELCRQGFNLPSGIARYASVCGRWNEYLLFEQFYRTVAQLAPEQEQRRIVEGFLDYHHDNLFPLLAWGLSEEHPEHLGHFLRGAAAYGAQPDGSRQVKVWL